MFELKNKSGVEYLTVPSFERTGAVHHCYTTRRGGVSKNEYDSLNLRLNCSDSRENVEKNFRIICDAVGINFENLVFSKQVHSDTIYTVTKNDCGRGLSREAVSDTDALICAEAGIPIAIFTADCTPVYLLDPKKRVIGLAHSGWKGTVKRISQKLAYKMKRDFGCRAEDMLAAIGPHIGACHFEVGDEVAEVFRDEFGDWTLVKKEKYHVDMQKAVLSQLADEGIKNITCADMCTYCHGDLFFSHRLTNGRRGVCAAIMEIVK